MVADPNGTFVPKLITVLVRVKIMAKIKITVISKIDPAVVFKGKVPNMPNSDKPYETCIAFEEGQEFIVEDRKMPEGFCDWAWNDIQRDLTVLDFGGNFWPEWMEPGKIITCCTDGVRPVSFHMERIEE